jgi:branched-chain amino acid aminotransferase
MHRRRRNTHTHIHSWEAIEEAGTSNFFAVFPNNTLVTPSLADETILAGVTRASILELAERECGLNVVEGRLTLNDLKSASEAFCCGTGASVSPVGHISVVDRWTPEQEVDQMNFGDGTTPGPITKNLYKMLLDIQMGTDAALCQKYSDWIHIVEP